VDIAQRLDGIDVHLDGEVAQDYKNQPLAQDWARVSKIIEELGEVIGNLILYTGQNPRKRARGDVASLDDVLAELADVAITAMLGMTHFTKDGARTWEIVCAKLEATYQRINEYHSESKAG
jgi:NTP pyrophosphatase (non-canonical NTP hydrolase)